MLLIHIVTILMIIEFIYIFILEGIKTTSQKTAHLFHLSQQSLADKTTCVLLKNLGIYNLAIGLLLLLALLFCNYEMLLFLSIGIIIIAIYGAITSQFKILLLQGTLPIINICLILFYLN